MGVEDEIRQLLQNGNSAKTIIEMGFNKSKVYEIENNLKTLTNKITRPEWVIENILYDKLLIRYLPGDTASVTFYFKNNSKKDLYVVNIGIQTEWMIRDNSWHCQKFNGIIKPNQKNFVTLTFPIPENISFGEYELLFGVECHYLPVVNNSEQLLATQWSAPQIIHIKHPMTNEVIFLSHSVTDKQLVYQLSTQLDQFGIKTIIGEDENKPGEFLEKKFKEQIESSTIFIALLTDNAVRSQWVKMEVNYALQINKPRILMKENSLDVDMNYEWTPFSKHDTADIIFQNVMSALKNLKEPKELISPTTKKIIGGALVGLLIGVTLMSLKK